MLASQLGEHPLEKVVRARDLVPAESLQRARLVGAETGESLAVILTRLGLVSEQALARALADATGLPVAEPSDYPEQRVAADRLSARFLRDIRAVPLALDDKAAAVALVDPLEPYALGALALALDRPVKAWIARPSDAEAALERLYGTAQAPSLDEGLVDDADLEHLKDLASDAPVIRAVNRLIARAVEVRASDIHLEPDDDGLNVRLRIDGDMQALDPLPASMRQPLISRIKIMAGLNIAEKRLPQDGRMRLAVRGHAIDLRVATSPTIHGESAVLRLLDRSHVALDFAALGFDAESEQALRTVLALPHGITLVTGPTGSGKTTTLYAALAVLNRPDRKILTVEDPIEYRLAGISQTQIAPAIGLTFASALRSFLRQDPDIVMVGEIRDQETADIAVQAALTGHTLLSTLHTNSAAASITRLLDMGVEPYLITSALNAVLAQRLVRRLCPACRQPVPPDRALLDSLGCSAVTRTIDRLYEPVGCAACGQTGYAGRLALVELLRMDDAIAHLALERADARDIQEAAERAGMRTMLVDGLLKAGAGATSLAEVLRVTRET